MTRRALFLVVTLWSCPALADDAIEIVPACVSIDLKADTLSAPERERAVRELTRALEQHDVLVVEHDCTDHYVLAHANHGIELTGPLRSSRAPDLGERASLYTQLVDEVLLVEPVRPVDAERPEDEAAHALLEEVPSPRSHLYLQALAGGGGTGLGIGYRTPLAPAYDFDAHAAASAWDEHSLQSIGAALVRNTHPDADGSTYLGGGVSFANDSTPMETTTGPRIDLLAGYAFGRYSPWGGFLQAELAVPMATGSATMMLSLGVGR